MGKDTAERAISFLSYKFIFNRDEIISEKNNEIIE